MKASERESDGKTVYLKMKVRELKSPIDGPLHAEVYVVKFTSSKQCIDMTKAELVDAICNADKHVTAKLREHPSHILRDRLTNMRFLRFSYLMLDVHNVYGILSKTFQKRALIVSEISSNIRKVLKRVGALKRGELGKEETTFAS
jgi:hypothetical protein